MIQIKSEVKGQLRNCLESARVFRVRAGLTMGNELRVLVVGAGSIGERHVRCLIEGRRAAVGVCELNEALRERMKCTYGIARAFPTLDDALRQHWDAAVIATPADTHVRIARRLAEHRVHLLIEKPLAVSLDGVADLMQVVREGQMYAAVAYVHRAHPALAAMRDALRSGRFGKPLQVVSVSGHHFPNARPAYRQIYYADRARGGGAIQDALTHAVNAAEWLVGATDRVVADASRQRLVGVEVEDTVHLITRHGGVMGAFVLNQYQMPNEFYITVVCEGGTARYEPGANRWRWMDQPGGQWRDEAGPPLERDGWFMIQTNQFLDVVAGTRQPLCTLEEGAQTLRVNLAALRSADAGAVPVRIEEVAL